MEIIKEYTHTQHTAPPPPQKMVKANLEFLILEKYSL